MKAFIVTEECDGKSEICFANHAVVARREGAAELGEEFADVSCRRAPYADAYAPGPVPLSVLWDAGWWFGCDCGERTSKDDGGTPTKDGAICDSCHAKALSSESAPAENADG